MPRKSPARCLNEEELTTALTVLAYCRGNSRKAAALLRTQGITVSQQTLAKWRAGLHADRYRELYHRLLPDIERIAAQRTEEIAESQAELEELLTERARKEYRDIPARDLPGAIRNTAVAKAVNIDKSLLMRGRPTQITSNLQAEPLLRKLQAIGLMTVDSTAEELDESEELPPAA
jgi:hypothetical protein